ncbi:MAG TPA: hypothetical protein VJ183_00080 [Chloroflexia bacterium]|nr:hypothetical protein [Chloroflexia bacterium]
MTRQIPPSNNKTLGHLNYLHGILTQPAGQWEGFYRAQSPSMNFALRYQLAFATYALAAMAQRTPAYRAPYAEAMRCAIERMLDVSTWGYWRAPEVASRTTDDGRRTTDDTVSSGHIAVLVSPHQRIPAGPPSDPIVHNNLQYSGHLSTMLGLYEKVTGDRHYDQPFTLSDPDSGVSFTYTHTEVAQRIFSQMRDNRFGGVCCEPGMAYVPCNNYSMASNTLHDALHETSYSSANDGWLRTVRRKMVLRGPALRGVFGASYMKDLHLATPVAFNFTDAWGLAFLLPFDRPLVKKLYTKFRQKVERAGAEGAYVGSSPVSEKMEISDVPINTGFGSILARGLGDMKLADAFHRYASTHFDAGWEGNRYFYRGAPRALHATALYALAASIESGGEDFARLFTATPDPSSANQPFLERVLDPSGRIGVCQAEYSPQKHILRIGLVQVGDPVNLRQVGPVEATLVIKNIEKKPHIKVDERILSDEEFKIDADGSLHLILNVEFSEVATCSINF